jgi:hypothetical protein
MLTYRIRPRVLKIDPPKDVSFPADVCVRFHFEPKQPFGGTSDGGRTAAKDTPATALFNANTGHHSIESRPPFERVSVVLTSPDQTIDQTGAVFSLRRRVASVSDLGDFLDSLYFALPVLYNAYFADPPVVARVDGTIGDATFRWELREWSIGFDITTNENQEERITRAFATLQALSNSEHRRVFAALHYFHVACRLDRAGATPGEFLAEALLNYAKILEVLFPPANNLQSRESIRAGLLLLEYTDETIERDYMSAIALRNEIDVAHVDLTLFTSQHLKALHKYTLHAERTFRSLLARVSSRLVAGTFVPVVWTPHGVDARTRDLLDRLTTNMDALDERAF